MVHPWLLIGQGQPVLDSDWLVGVGRTRASVWLIWQTLVWFVWHLGVIICKCLDDGRGSGRVWVNWHIKHEQWGSSLTRKLQDVTNDEQWCDALIILQHCCWIIITLAPNSSYYIQIYVSRVSFTRIIDIYFSTFLLIFLNWHHCYWYLWEKNFCNVK